MIISTMEVTCIVRYLDDFLMNFIHWFPNLLVTIKMQEISYIYTYSEVDLFL